MPADFTPDDLKRILREGAGTDDAVDLDTDILDTAFTALGYESLAMLETFGRIEREYGIDLAEDTLTDDLTPRRLIAVITGQLSGTPAA
ncbi:acyl carrier protein [Streptomyces roseirectus]|uniref:Acyl carrier protein n=1 Tax=Streptomyces roseirectus TaxID=2768066 RepID=A0A7H0IR22_9ACTN|nr:acyl carrier protein [Streptomyces roseirectus]QNP75238.1 acyl carrier protein [Streptomyces roseirectus]